MRENSAVKALGMSEIITWEGIYPFPMLPTRACHLTQPSHARLWVTMSHGHSRGVYDGQPMVDIVGTFLLNTLQKERKIIKRKEIMKNIRETWVFLPRSACF